MPKLEIKRGEDTAPRLGASAWAYAVREEFMRNPPHVIQQLDVPGMRVEVAEGRQSLWLMTRWPSGGGLAIRLTYCPDASSRLANVVPTEYGMELFVTVAAGKFRVRIELADRENGLIHWTVAFTPNGDMVVPFWPVNIYPLDEFGDPLATEGKVHAGQRGLAVGVVFASLTKPTSGTFLYLQNFSSLNEYCDLTKTSPNSRVGGSWPEIGYTPPLAERQALPAGHEVVICDSYIQFTEKIPADGRESAVIFLDMLASIYKHLPRPNVFYRDWPTRAEQTLKDLSHSPECVGKFGDLRYLCAYVGTCNRRPESMVQLTILPALIEYSKWADKPVPLIDELRRTLPMFYDTHIGCVLRYPISSADTDGADPDEKGPWEIDSWYLYHPLANLGRLASWGDEDARDLFFKSLEYAIRVARHFEYHWPILFDAQTFEVIKERRKEGEEGETDVPGLYAYVMLQAWELTGKQMYLDEAKRAAKALEGLDFNIGYQFNNTAWAAIALLRLWKITNTEFYRNLSYVCLASILHNCFLWECEYGFARDYHTFFGVTPLHDGAYIATYEEHEVFAAFHEYLSLAATDIPTFSRYLLAEFYKYSLDQVWSYYPSELPEEAVSPHPRNGHIDRKLMMPLEDIYEGWQQAGQVGQQVYGAAAPFAFVARAYYRSSDMPLMIFCDYPVSDFKIDPDIRHATFTVAGDGIRNCMLRLIPLKGSDLPEVTVSEYSLHHQGVMEGDATPDGHLQYTVVGENAITVEWQEKKKHRKQNESADDMERELVAASPAKR